MVGSTLKTSVMPRVGDKLTTLCKGWYNLQDYPDFRAPKYLEVVTVREVRKVPFNDREGWTVMISLMGYSDRLFFPAKHFRELDREFSDMILNQIKSNHW